MIPASVSEKDGTAEIALGEHTALGGHKVNITIEKSDGGKQTAVITQDTLDQKAVFTLEGAEGDPIIFRVEMVD